KIRALEHHGRETYVVHYGDHFVLKRPLPDRGDAARQEWLDKQHRTYEIIEEIKAVDNPVYNIPRMFFINDDEYQILEERAPGYPLTPALYRTVSRRQKFEIQNAMASFLVDMNELRPVGDVVRHKISSELKFARLDNFVENKMSKWFTSNEVRYMARLKNQIGTFEYDTRSVWSHCDLNSGNVMYDPVTSQLSFIDFAEAGYRFIYRDIISAVGVELDIYKNIYELYVRLHDKHLYPMPSPKNDQLRDIVKYRIMVIWLKRFIKAADDLRTNPANEKSVKNNLEKMAFMRDQIQNFQNLERRYAKKR
ncbi:MAG: aminoglycoside phosphotransferase family protein, partial [Alphaproteobacteria bacterium]|nr:aminoglycoside phosphotransferase family protein [Alphaproteobacteria bacterium]